ncbi:rhomboid-domain-containing protein [Amniculicola lignicola CBS 123094]|uniref:Rhomboid-type serine protease n=1 Tax=Amniculicola lignicola CBS 123094 TaxID=1392246 RepID=A0A6A5WVE5_9PLEO|nr:rhomboid-domain-containing protein [Amniculicola lignicola CBS 123094]
MAANDYYTSTATSHHRTTDSPLPPTPGNQSTQSISPVASPFDDDHRYDYNSTTHLPSHTQSTGYEDTSYQPHMYNKQGHGTDPFADQNAIPLQAQGKLDGPTRYDSDLEARSGGGYMQYGGVQPPPKKKGWLSGRVTWVVYIMTAVQIGVFVGELIKNGMLTGSPIQIKPQFNIMIGPSRNVLINMGARYTPCMHTIDQILHFRINSSDTTSPYVELPFLCPNTTTDQIDFENKKQDQCSLGELCGFGGVPYQEPGTDYKQNKNAPNQWFRFILPIFLHAGIIHIGFNMLLQWTLGRDMEKEIGSLRFLIIYFSAGIFGFVLGGNYAAPNNPSVGASGSLFGILALVLLDLLYTWKTRRSPVKDLLFILLDMAIAFVLGLLPGLDNFSHIGGFLMGFVLGICLLRSPQALRERIGVDEPPYTTVQTSETPAAGVAGLSKFAKSPVGFFKGRKPLWWAWWLARVGALIAVFIGFILLLKNFYEWRNTCSWCHRLTCLPVNGWCEIGTTFIGKVTFQNDTNNNSNNRRDILFGSTQPIDFGRFY